MSVPSSHIRCHGCEYQGFMQHRPLTLRYMLPDGDTVDTGREFGWCRNCEGIRDVEGTLDVNAIRSELETRKPKRQSISRLFKNAIDRALGGKSNDAQVQLHELANLLRLAELRRSSARCLSCGKEDVSYVAFDEQGTSSNFVHSCGGRLYRVPSDPDGPRFFYRPEIIRLDVEGHRLAKDES
ncbi:MAG: hypothetical protein KGL51_00760 [Betaproteobacteria bacterium]|nr:hypothetical protein [Betaproteobacteria bacterium]MDE2323194.1 hypothetical protein [Betaproteobacteria bacterium]